MPLMAKKIRITNAVLLLSTAVPTWLVSEALTPQIVQAYTNRVDLEITRFPGDNYQSLLRRAEAVARAAAQRSFDKDILVTDVSVVVSAQNYGAIAPVLELNVSRIQWRNRPDTQRWAKYFKMARTLLFFGQNTKNSSNAAQEVTPQAPEENSTPTQEATPQPSEENLTPPENSEPEIEVEVEQEAQT
ncbi:MAG: hypothetical protein AAFR37_12535 [Cyanobacteria bacterium J06628_3]